MLQLNHLSLSVPDVAATKAVFEEFFGFTCKTIKGDNVIAVLRGEGNQCVVLTTQKQTEAYPKDFHFGFIVKTQSEVDDTYQKLAQAGFAGEAPRKIRDSYGFYFHIPGNILTEVSCPL
ncbi:VOC family protein [Dinghuibacter silviterrae]|uniref:Glyoxalase/bleomycin resistance protein/dioxygenase superfamily protein n=1 Tax=Dinghuibacter silviterrae TaxID=1539049 RepID=A0A4R8DUA9_9BACT|nr:VOC family protein [Dinghuibacter silviterrae]TDX01739.1 glyoxalase/bleomycin resistance protein/dioxygenase superfamily protein [Dinghuibacter silviterrae]